MKTDNTSNMIKDINEAGYTSLSCLLHTLHLVMKDSIFRQQQ